MLEHHRNENANAWPNRAAGLSLGLACGSVGGLMVRGDPVDQERAIARALEAGVNYFDTAVQYGDGVGTKPRPRPKKPQG
jgi:aryl-alcohol dehydrogenase-like predicted oxidoreductase